MSAIAAFQEECINAIATQVAPIAELTLEQARALISPAPFDKSNKDGGDYLVSVQRINKFKKLTASPADTVKAWISKVRRICGFFFLSVAFLTRRDRSDPTDRFDREDRSARVAHFDPHSQGAPL